MRSTWIAATIAVAAAVIAVGTLVPITKQTRDVAKWSVYRDQYYQLQGEMDNLLARLEKDYDKQAAYVDGLSASFAVVRGQVDGGNLGRGAAEAFSDRGTPLIITVTSDSDKIRTTYYLNADGKPFLVVRSRPIVGAPEPYVDRWYFVDGEFATHRDSDPTTREGARVYYAPTGDADIENLKALLYHIGYALKLKMKPW